jgi:hypothetical protein
MTQQLSNTDLDVIIKSLSDSKHFMENYTKYPNADFKQEQIDRVSEVLSKVKEIRKNQ